MKNIKTGILLIGLAMLFVTNSESQAFKTVKATRQPWAGGVVGRSGINYFIEIETSSHTLVPDTVWINGYVYPIESFSKNGQYSQSIDSVTHHIRYSMLMSEQHEDPYMHRNPNQKKDTASVKPKHLRPFEGAALISYRHNKKQRFFTVKSFTELKPLNYP